MLGEFLHSFFFWMPAVVAMVVSGNMASLLARRILFWGGLGFAVVIGVAVLGMLLCDGRSLSVYGNCAGGPLVERLFAGGYPVFSTATYLYLFLGPALAGIAYLAEWLHNRRGAPA